MFKVQLGDVPMAMAVETRVVEITFIHKAFFCTISFFCKHQELSDKTYMKTFIHYIFQTQSLSLVLVRQFSLSPLATVLK